MAYIMFAASQFIPFRNHITVNGSEPVRIQNGAYKVDPGTYTVVVHGANGTCWECEGRINSSSACLSIRLTQDQEGNITNASYAVFEMDSKQEFVYGSTAKKLVYTTTKVDPDRLQERSDRPQETSAPSARPTSVSQSSPGCAVFSMLCLMSAAILALLLI